MEYINKEDLLNLIHEYGIYPAYFVKMVEKMPKVELVRCKDCRYYNEDCMSPHSGWCECLEHGEYNEHFCSYGEPKEVE